MKELVEVIAKSLVDYPEEVDVTEKEDEKYGQGNRKAGAYCKSDSFRSEGSCLKDGQKSNC